MNRVPRQRITGFSTRRSANPVAMYPHLMDSYERDMYTLLKRRTMGNLHKLCVENDVRYLDTDTKDTVILKLLRAKIMVPAYQGRN